jgi:hypothetical protein
MRALAFALTGSAAILASLGLAFAVAAPRTAEKPAVVAKPAPLSAARLNAAMAFPNCAAPAVNGMNIRIAREGGLTRLTVFVVVQNVGHRAFFADQKPAILTLNLGARQLSTFTVDRLAPGEVKFFAAETQLEAGPVTEDLVASLDIDGPEALRPAAEPGDCQPSDNRAVRRAPSLQASLDRAQG